MEYKQCSVNNRIFENKEEIIGTLTSNLKSADMQALHEFFKILAVCHTVVLDKDKNGNETMQASFPDELALV
jgi:magnesium-transporting ATPase (P-type)